MSDKNLSMETDKRYLILSYVVEFDKIYYPIILNPYDDFTKEELL